MDESPKAPAKVEAVTEGGRAVLRVSGRLDVETTPALFTETQRLVDAGAKPSQIDATGVERCDSAGAAWLLWLGVPVSGANEQVTAVLDLVTPRENSGKPGGPRGGTPEPAERTENFVQLIGRETEEAVAAFHAAVVYGGTLVLGLVEAIRNPRSMRWKDLTLYMTRTGSEALPIVALITFLVGVIIAFQASVQLHQFGADLYVADAVALSMVMELGPLMTAIIMAGRSGSAFAAEIGTMKVNEEVDALDTMGLDRTRFLVMPKFIALLLMMPLLVTFASFCGIAGGLLIGVWSIGLPATVYLHETVDKLTIWRATQGYIKGESYAVVIAAVGCLRGLQTRAGAQGVGLSATSAVVTGIFLIICVDAVLTVVFHYVG